MAGVHCATLSILHCLLFLLYSTKKQAMTVVLLTRTGNVSCVQAARHLWQTIADLFPVWHLYIPFDIIVADMGPSRGSVM